MTTELYILWSELSRRKQSPTFATTRYSCPDNAIELVAQSELSGYVNWATFWRQLGGHFHTYLATLPLLETLWGIGYAGLSLLKFL